MEPDPVDEVAFVKVQHLTDFADAQLHGFSRHLFVLELAFEEGTGGQRAVVLRRHLCCFFSFGFFISFLLLQFFLETITPMPPKKAAPAAMVPSKESFFMPKRVMVPNKNNPVLKVESSYPRQYVKPPRLLYEQGTQEAYAELVGNTAVCLFTGMDLFTMGSGDSECFDQTPSSSFERRFDFTPPGGKRHPDDRFVDVQNLVKAGIISEADVARQRAFTDEELKAAMAELESYGFGDC